MKLVSNSSSRIKGKEERQVLPFSPEDKDNPLTIGDWLNQRDLSLTSRHHAFPFFVMLMVITDLGLFVPPLRFIASLILIGFLPGYFLVERFDLWRNPIFAAVGSMSLSFLLSPLIVLPGCILFHQVNPVIIAVSLNIFLFGMAFLMRGKKRNRYPEKDHSPLLAPLLVLICGWVFLYMDITKIGPYCEDWTYLFGIIKELSRTIPPLNPEASFLPLKQSWGFWFLFALLHSLGGMPAWTILEFVQVPLSFVYMGLVYMVLFQGTKNRTAGLWAIIFLAVGRYSGWVLRGFQGLGWQPDFYHQMSWQEIQAVTGYSFLWGWYTLPGLIPPLMAFFFMIRYLQEKQKIDLWFSLGACSISPFFHPVYYFGFLVGFSILLVLRWLKKRYDPWLLLYYLTFLPFFLTFFLYLKPASPGDPLYQFFLNKTFLIKEIWSYLGRNGVIIPFVLLALWKSPEARTYFSPFALLFSALCLLGKGGINHPSHFLLQDSLYITLLGAIGLSYIKNFKRWIFVLVSLLILTIILPPYIQEVAYRFKIGWEEALQVEQKGVGEFIRSQTDPDCTFLIFPDSQYSLVTIEGIGERKVILGALFHLYRYETITDLLKWDQEVKDVFLTPNFQKQIHFIKKYQVDYIFLGPDEMLFMKEHQVSSDKLANIYPAVYQSNTIQILKTEFRKQSGK